MFGIKNARGFTRQNIPCIIRRINQPVSDGPPVWFGHYNLADRDHVIDFAGRIRSRHDRPFGFCAVVAFFALRIGLLQKISNCAVVTVAVGDFASTLPV